MIINSRHAFEIGATVFILLTYLLGLYIGNGMGKAKMRRAWLISHLDAFGDLDDDQLDAADEELDDLEYMPMFYLNEYHELIKTEQDVRLRGMRTAELPKKVKYK